jgi:hypothetical protein
VIGRVLRVHRRDGWRTDYPWANGTSVAFVGIGMFVLRLEGLSSAWDSGWFVKPIIGLRAQFG